MQARVRTGSLPEPAPGRVRLHRDEKKPPEGGFFFKEAKITSRGLREQQVQQRERQQEQRREPKRQQQEPERVQQREQEPERVQQLLLSCRKQTGRRRPEQLPERETSSFLIP